MTADMPLSVHGGLQILINRQGAPRLGGGNAWKAWLLGLICHVDSPEEKVKRGRGAATCMMQRCLGDL